MLSREQKEALIMLAEITGGVIQMCDKINNRWWTSQAQYMRTREDKIAAMTVHEYRVLMKPQQE